MMVDAWRTWPGGKLLLIGPEGGGKTHLAHIWAEDRRALIADLPDLTVEAVPALADLGAVVVEGGDRLAELPDVQKPEVERALFHLHNELAVSGGHLLITGRTPPSHWGIATADLLSRLSAATAVTLPAPDDRLLRDVMAKLFRDRQKRISDDLLPYLLPRMERSLSAAGEIVALLDAAALERKAALTPKFAAKVLGWGPASAPTS